MHGVNFVSTRRLALTSFLSSVALSTSVAGFQSFFLTPLLTIPKNSARRRSLSTYSATTTRTTTPSMSSPANTNQDNAAGGLFLFDFDGVVCDSCDECTVSAWRTCQRLGVLDSDKFASLDHPPEWLFAKMREIRPAIEVGWQIPVLLAVFLQQEQQNDEAPAMSVADMIANYQSLVDDWLTQNNKTESDMIETFGQVRDDWIRDDLSSWLDINRFYPGVPQAMNQCLGNAVLVTTKQQRFAIALCRHAGVTETCLPDEKIYGLGQYKKKADVIVQHMTNAASSSPQRVHFFEDRWPTLAKCLQDERLMGVNFYLCAWGYVAASEMALATAEPRVTVLQLDDFGKVVAGTTTPAAANEKV